MPSAFLPPLAGLDSVLALVIAAPERRPPAGSPKPLRALFRELQQPTPRRDPDEIEELIWAHWISHDDPAAAQTMLEAIDAMHNGSLDLAELLLERLVRDYPDWPEAWNKRATLAFINEKDGQAVSDIGRTLVLEPRHFGALSGFGQICLRQKRPIEARAAFMVALTINPHLKGLEEAIADIGAPVVRLH